VLSGPASKRRKSLSRAFKIFAIKEIILEKIPPLYL
jgi:hypothetical protein